ncbi:transferase [Zychaea mexicana]|uniref:transferase n=1 Tax=Zychaea mexicana TaxID=64656 RepID=UPI0022FEE135|nr:transferase [Zychaea mexicana]KAI9494545.1 transferase [Zychaea mexicana]
MPYIILMGHKNQNEDSVVSISNYHHPYNLKTMPSETTIIHPTNKHNRPFPTTAIPLHGLDLFGAPIQILNHRFFQPPTTNSFADVVGNLKSSLAEALELYPPVNGTLKKDREKNVYIAMDDAHRPGTPFTVETKDAPFTTDSEDLSPRAGLVLPPGSTTLAVKVTQVCQRKNAKTHASQRLNHYNKFSCGTVVIASSLHHLVADLRGFLNFLEVWAQLARGEPVDFTRIPDDWTHTPGRFFTRLDHEPVAPPPFTVLPTPATRAYAYLTQPSEATRWKISQSEMEQLKKDFSPACKDAWISSGDALASLISGAITRARARADVQRLEGRSSEETQSESVAMAADGRDRAPHGNMAGGHYFGNFNHLWSATLARADLLTATPKAGSRVALAIRNELKVQLSPDAIANRVALFENTNPRKRITWTADVILSNWCRFDLQGASFDMGWGKPFKATPGAGAVFPPGYSLMTHDKASGIFNVLITVEVEGGAALKADPLLNKYAELQ